jgi:hypothetical protein
MSSRRQTVWLVVVTLAAVLPIVVAAVRALTGDWYPIGDNAVIVLRGRDVLTEHHPLLGTWTSASLEADTDFNNPGPLLFDAIALPAKLDLAAGTVIGVAILNSAAIILAVLFARRVGGLLGALGVGAASVGLSWAMGSALLIEPWQPHAIVFPFLLVLVCAWALAAGDLLALPVGIVAGSLVVQSHLSYALLVPALLGFGLGVAIAFLRRERRRTPSDWPAARRRVRRVGLVSLVVLLLCWAQPLVEQFTADDGNLGRVATSAGRGEGFRIGVDRGLGVLSKVLALPPWWGGSSFADALKEEALLPTPGTGAIALAVVVALVGACVVIGWRRRDRAVVTIAGTALVALVIGMVSAFASPYGVFGLVAHHLRWLWPVSVFTMLAVIFAAFRSIPNGERWGARLLAVAMVVLLALALPAKVVKVGPAADADGMAAARELAAQLDAADLDGPVLVETDELFFAEAFNTVVMLELAREGVDFEVGEGLWVRQVGDSRQRDEARRVLTLRYGDHASETPAGAEKVASVDAAPDELREEMARLVPELERALAAGEIRLTSTGRRAMEIGTLEIVSSDGTTVDPALLPSVDVLGAMTHRDFVELEGELGRQLRRFSELERAANVFTVAAFVTPVEPR